MSAPARILRSPSLGSSVRASTPSECSSVPPWRPLAIEQRQQSRAVTPPAQYLSTTTRPSRPSHPPSSPRRSLSSLQLEGATISTTPKPQLPGVWFTAHPPLLSLSSEQANSNKPPDERKLKLGKTLRILQPRLPTLLQAPLPQEILSPRITLHLFPSTHPHLPTVTGRVAYIAALWSSPIAWNRVPLVGNVRLEILSERMVDNPSGMYYATLPEGRRPEGAVGEQLVVRWRTVGGGGALARLGKGLLGLGGGNGKGKKARGKALGVWGEEKEGGGIREAKGVVGGKEDGETEVKAPVGTAMPARSTSKEFTGLFIFDFDSEGRILSHTIEHVQEGGQWEKGVGAKVVGLTDWLLGGIKGGDAPCPAFARKGRS
ncbi:hypothetical protein VTI74DRAFT_10867 [Chaetomium olivicolor]